MAVRSRKFSEHRAYLEKERALPAVIPYTTWRRWSIEGKITEEKLLEMGINPARRRQRRAPQIQEVQNMPNPPVPATTGDSNTILNPVAESDSDSSLSGILDIDSDLNASSVTCLSDLDQTDVSDGDQLDDKKGMFSILESKKIGMEHLNQPLTAGSRLTRFEVMLMIFHLMMRHSLNYAFLEDLIYFVNELKGDHEAIPSSKFLFQKLFMFGSKPVVHFVCPTCSQYLGPKSSFESTVECDSCDWQKSASSSNDNNYFVTLNLKDQLREVLHRPQIKLVSRSAREQNVIADMFDGQIYRKLMRESGPLSNENALTISFSTDGSPVFKNGPNTLYPIHFHLNEIVPQHRFDVENMLLGGLWFSKKGDPNLQIFLKSVVDELILLQESGVIWRKPNGLVTQSPVYLTCVCADSVARPKVQNFSLFNSAFGCSYCMHPNISIKVTEPVKNHQGIKASLPTQTCCDDNDIDDTQNQQQPILFRETQIKRYVAGTDYPLRTNKSLRKHLKLAAQSHLDNIYGAKGNCVLASLSKLDLTFGVPIDYMHAVLLGIIKRLSNLWFDSKNKGKPYYTGLKIEAVNSRLAQITPPSNVMKPRSMTVRAFWKAKEWKAFLLYYGLPCLEDILPTVYYSHFKKLSTAIFIYTKECIGYDEADEAEDLLQEYVNENQLLYVKLTWFLIPT